jgi:hypothetical protein
MNIFEEYVHELESLASSALAGDNNRLDKTDFETILNGGTGAELRRRVALEERQRIGAFFTGASLRARAFEPVLGSPFDETVWDPACGAGDLLLSYAEKLRVPPDISEAISSWGGQLWGSDTEHNFIRAAKARLVLSAYYRGARRLTAQVSTLEESFPEIRQENSLLISSVRKPANIALNPPFVMVPASHDCEWGKGSVCAAAVFVETCLKRAKPGTQMIAILPDVLRTGARYERWRQLVQEFADIRRLEIYGPFDPQADVDVFILELEAYEKRLLNAGFAGPWGVQQISQKTLGEQCIVSVGSVVPHRHKEEGPEIAFLHSKDAIPWGSINQIKSRRRFMGKSVQPPFVVIRRTSSPRDKQRAIGTIVNCESPVAVENHLIICRPNARTLDACRKIIEALKSTTTTEWLNSRIRCRHLTVDAVRGIPWND